MFSILNAAGSPFRKEEFAATTGTGIYRINDFEYLNSGVYVLRIESGGQLQTLQLLKN